MANLNKVMLIGRLTRDPEVRTFSNGGKVAHFGFAVNNKKKNATTGQWEDEPVFLDVEAFNRGTTGRQLADLVEQYFRKGAQFYLEGHLKLDQWTSSDNQKRQKIKIVLEEFQFFEPRGAAESRAPRGEPVPQMQGDSYGGGGYQDRGPEPEPMMDPPVVGGDGENIPF